LEKEITVPLGVLVERRKIDHPWAEWSWKPVAVLSDPPAIDPWLVLKSDRDVTQFHAATVDLNLHRTLVEAYRTNLAGDAPLVWVVLQEADSDDEASDIWPYKVHSVTVSPYEAQDHLDGGDEIVESVAMPEAILTLLLAFVRAHPEEQVFKKRKRDRLDVEELKFGKLPIFAPGNRLGDQD